MWVTVSDCLSCQHAGSSTKGAGLWGATKVTGQLLKGITLYTSTMLAGVGEGCRWRSGRQICWQGGGQSLLTAGVPAQLQPPMPSLQQESLLVQESGPLLSRAMNCRAMAPLQQACLCAGHQQGNVQQSWPIKLTV